MIYVANYDTTAEGLIRYLEYVYEFKQGAA
jgi:hypothetical protein